MSATARPDAGRILAGPGPRPEPGTLTQLFFDAVARYDKPDALMYREGSRYHSMSHRELADRVRRVGLGLLEQGLRPGDRVALISENRPEWAIADYACLTVGLVDVPLYPNLPAAQLAPMLADSGAAAAFVSTADQAAKLASVRDRLPALRLVVSFAGEPVAGADLTLGELEAWGSAADTPSAARTYRERALAIRPDDLATIIYTSGTTGEPKGVMLTHDNIHSNVVASRTRLPFAGNDVSLSFLPLSHIFGRMSDHYLMFAVGSSIAYVENLDALATAFTEVRPTFVFAVPRVFEKVHAGVIDRALHGGAASRRIFLWARAVAERWTDARLAGRPVGTGLAAQYGIARALVFSRLTARLGGRVRYFVSGGAPLSADINRFFYGAGLVILEGYGLTETSPVITVNVPDHFRIGTVGGPLAGIEVRTAPDGEVLTRGPHVMRGYYNKPDATREAIDDEGWFHTGDIGEIEDGFLTITDRKKDLIVTAGGKNIAPAPIENRVRASPFVAQAVMVGDRRRFPALLLVPNFAQLERWARGEGLTWSDHAALVRLAPVRELMEREALAQLTGLASFEMPKRVAVLDREFSIEHGELTPKLNVKRRAIDRLYAETIDALYGEAGPGR